MTVIMCLSLSLSGRNSTEIQQKSLQINFSNRFPTSWKLAYFPRQVNFKDAAAEPEENRATVWGHNIPVIGRKDTE